MSPTRIDASIHLWRSQLPFIKPYYAVKCNPAPVLLNYLYHSGKVNFDCASEKELRVIQGLSLHGEVASRIIYANPCKSIRDILVAKKMGAPTTVVDSVEELEKLRGYDGGALVRVAVDDRSSAMPFSTKFGASPESVGGIAEAAKALKIPLRGVSFHVGSGCSDGESYAAAIDRAYECILKIRWHGHKDAAVLDIGGGYLSDEADFRRKAMAIRGASMDVSYSEKESGGPGITWIAEPGRFLAGPAFDFFVQVIGKKAMGAGWKYTLDDSLYGQFSCILFDYAQPKWMRVEMASKPTARRRSPGVLFGRTCDSVDVIARAESMEELEVGDWLWFPAMGAYTRATASEFNGFPTPTVFEVVDLPVPDVRTGPGLAQQPKGVTRMPPVSARAFWAAGIIGKN